MKEEYPEYKATYGALAVSDSYFCQVVRTAPELAHIKHARPCLNFQHCKRCVELHAAVMAALKSGDKAALAVAKQHRSHHFTLQRRERLCYYARAEDGKDPTKSVLSMIIDKWDSAKTSVPYFARSMTWWQTVKHDILEQHVVGVLVHGVPNHSFLYTINNTIGGGANLNVEAIRRTLVHLHSSTPMPRKFVINADNASDNKCWTLLLFLAMLVYHRYTDDVILSFLLVGHTHEDIDQLFSVLSRYLKKLTRVMGPREFQAELRAAMQDSVQSSTIELVQAVLDWDRWLRPLLIKPAPTGIQHADLSGKTRKEKAAEVESGAVAGDNEVRIPHQFWLHRRADGTVVLHYKEYAQHAVFLPKVRGSDPAQTDPEGIVLFGSPPPDPMVTPPEECELKSVCTAAAP